jgi:sulfite reductase (ferredoxin)
LLKKLSKKNWADAIYLAYAGFVNGAKAILLKTKKQIHQESSICLIVFVEKKSL